jgi:hypothetical protein
MGIMIPTSQISDWANFITYMASNTLGLIFDGHQYSLGGFDYEKVYGMVVFLDPLGIKGIWKTNDPAKVLENWVKAYSIFSNSLSHLASICQLSRIHLLSAFAVIQPWRLVDKVCDSIIPAFLSRRSISTLGAISPTAYRHTGF